MTAWQVVGALILLLPFAAGAIYVIRDMGWRAFAEIFGGTAAIVAMIGVGCALLAGDLP